MNRWIQDTIKNEGKSLRQLEILITSDTYLLEINRRYLEHNYLTDVITFGEKRKGFITGEIYISQDRVYENAGRLGVDPDQEMYRVIVHGVLHTLGYSDLDSINRAVMRGKEDFYLKRLLALQQ